MSIRHDALLLKTLSGSKMHGHQIILEIKEKSNNFFNLQTGTVYPLLHSLEKRGFIESHTDLISGRERKVYSITAEGNSYLENEILEWHNYCRAVEKILSK